MYEKNDHVLSIDVTTCGNVTIIFNVELSKREGWLENDFWSKRYLWANLKFLSKQQKWFKQPQIPLYRPYNDLTSHDSVRQVNKNIWKS